MTFELALWPDTFPREEFPPWPCPHCGNGTLVFVVDTLKVEEPRWSKDAHGVDEWEFDWIEERFSAELRCSKSTCGDIVFVSGDTIADEVYDEEFGRSIRFLLRPRSVFPAPPIIKVPKETPPDVVYEIKQAFATFWIDHGSSANRLRVSVERMMDHAKIAKTTKNKKGETVPLSLSARIDKFGKKYPHKEVLHALRVVGNMGSHASADRTSLLTAYSVYEWGLWEHYGKTSAKMKASAKALVSGKGKLKPQSKHKK